MIKKGSKLICMVLVLLLMATVFAGCTQKSEEPAAKEGDTVQKTQDTGTVEQTPAKKVKIQYFSNKTGQQEYIQGMIDKYNKENKDNVEVETIWRTGDYATGLKTSLLAGQGPTVMTSHGFSGFDAIIGDVIGPWDDYVSPEFSEKYDSFKYKVEINDVFKTYAWAYSEITRKLIYNKDLFKKVGETEPPKTWNDVRRIAKKITEAGKGEFYGTAYPVGKGQIGMWTDTISAAAGRVNNYNYGKAQYDFMPLAPVVEVWRGMIQDGSVFPGFENMDNDAVRAQFASGKVGMLLSFSWDTSCINDQYKATIDWDAASLPAVDGEVKYLLDKRLGVENYLNAKASEDEKKAAGKFIEFFMSDEFVGGYMATGAGIAAINSAIEYAKTQPQPYPQFISYAPEADGISYLGYNAASSTLEGDNYNAVITNCLLDANINIVAALKDCTDRYNAGIIKRAETDLEKAKQMSIKIGGSGEMSYIEGWDPTKPVDFSKFKYLSIDEWKALQATLSK